MKSNNARPASNFPALFLDRQGCIFPFFWYNDHAAESCCESMNRKIYSEQVQPE
jgi:hypothetical protein